MLRTRRTLGVLAYALFLLACTELSLQVFYRVTAGAWLFQRATWPMWAPNEWSGVFNRPNLAFRQRTNEFDAMNFTNDQGLRVPEGRGSYPLDPPPDTTRILLLGPSFAYGWGVDYEESFAHVLEQRLEGEEFGAGRRVQVINAGVPSLRPAPQLNWFRHAGRQFQPAWVIQFIYGSMAVDNDLATGQTASPEGYLVRKDVPLQVRLRERAKNSALVFYTWIVYTRIDGLLSESGSREVLGAGRELRLRQQFDLEDPEVKESLELYRSLREEAGEAGARVIVVYFPLSYAVHPEDASRWRHLGVDDIAAQAAFDAALCEHLTTHMSLPCLDISGALRDAAQRSGERLYFWLDVHWTPAGNRTAAETVAAYLLARAPAERI